MSLPRGGSSPVGSRLEVLDNKGGLYASGGALTVSGPVYCKTEPCPVYRHRLRRNAQNAGEFDARAVEGSTVSSEGNDWGTGVTSQSDLTWYADGTSTVSVLPGVPGNKTGGAEALALRPALAAALEAERALALGDSSGAFSALISALGSARSEADAEAAYSAALRVLRAGGRAPASQAVRSLVRTRATRSGGARPWALRARAADLEASGDVEEGAEALRTLAAMYNGTRHEAHAWRELTRFAVEAGDEPSAVDAFAAMARAGASDEALRETASLVLAEFPEAEVRAPEAKRRADEEGESIPDALLGITLDTSPNPARETAAVTYTLQRAGDVRVAVYDALGREVAVVAQGSYEVGAHTARLSVSGFAPGVYVVRATTGEGAEESVRLTVVR